MLSQVSRDLHSFCDSVDPGLRRTKTIELLMSPTETILTFKIMIKRMHQYVPIRFLPIENGYRMECRDDSVTVENDCYLDGIRDVLMAHFTSKTSKIYKLSVIVTSERNGEWKKLVEKLSNSLFKSKINVEAVRFVAEDPLHFFPLLDILTPGYLEKIEISNDSNIEIPYQRLAETEQWKQAKKAFILGDGLSNPEHFPYFYHFEEIKIAVVDLTMEFLIELSNILIASPNFKICFIKGHKRFTAEDFASKIGGWTVDKEHVRLYSIDDTDDFLEFSGDFGGEYDRLRIDRRRFDFYENF
ncbi:hypothetical protein CAEBREN_19692 [Caenorhabditis brenneri]|uniref:DUF38 domain-containing protein n=1 Tax=Caenorhabditis brenneri TaxID=135651 RepID=G0NGF9_CAEBE|nr:hypothetical protein CAEBREN_19692 [Caenorhabditis brenneri]